MEVDTLISSVFYDRSVSYFFCPELFGFLRRCVPLICCGIHEEVPGQILCNPPPLKIPFKEWGLGRVKCLPHGVLQNIHTPIPRRNAFGQKHGGRGSAYINPPPEWKTPRNQQESVCRLLRLKPPLTVVIVHK